MKNRIPLILSIILFILVCVSASYWIMRLIKPETRKVSAPEEVKPVANVESVASLFGGAMLVDTSYQLKGVIQANPMRESVAIIGVDNNPTKAYTFDSQISGGSALNEVFSGYVLLKDHGITKRIELPHESTSSHITAVTKPPVGVNPAVPPNRMPNRGRGTSR